MNPTDSDRPDAKLLLRQAMAAHEAGRAGEAKTAYDQVLDRMPAHAQALRLRGILARELDDLAESRVLLERACAAAQSDPAPRTELALTLLASGDLADAEAALRAALDLAPDHGRALANLGALAQYRGRLPEAVACHRRYLQLVPQDLEVRCNLATALADSGQPQEALAQVREALAIAPGHPFVLATQGAVLLADDEFDQAARVLELATGRNPGDDMALTNLAHACFGSGRPDAAVAALRRAAQINPDNARAAADLALLLSLQGEATAALDGCDGFLARHPGERLVLAARANVLQAAGREAEAQYLLDFDRLIHIEDLDSAPDHANLESFNRELGTAVMGNPSLLAEPVSKATRGGRQTGELDLLSQPAFSSLERVIREAIRRYVRRLAAAGQGSHPVMAYASERMSLRVWGTVLEAGGRQASHLHPLGFVSGVYYVQLPAGMATADHRAGWLTFGTPPARFTPTRPAPVRWVEPRAGRLVLFPSYFRHATEPFEARESRISIAFDAMPQRPA